MEELKDPRKTFGEALVEAGLKNDRIVALSADSSGGSGTWDSTRAMAPPRDTNSCRRSSTATPHAGCATNAENARRSSTKLASLDGLDAEPRRVSVVTSTVGVMPEDGFEVASTSGNGRAGPSRATAPHSTTDRLHPDAMRAFHPVRGRGCAACLPQKRGLDGHLQ